MGVRPVTCHARRFSTYQEAEADEEDAMRKMSGTERVLLAAGVTVVTLALAAPAAADEPAAVSVLATPHSAPDPTEPPAVALDAESPARAAQTAGRPETRMESPTLPTPSDTMEPPPPPDSVLQTVIGNAIVVTFAPDHLRRPRRLP
jgi:hypothetical protein